MSTTVPRPISPYCATTFFSSGDGVSAYGTLSRWASFSRAWLATSTR